METFRFCGFTYHLQTFLVQSYFMRLLPGSCWRLVACGLFYPKAPKSLDSEHMNVRTHPICRGNQDDVNLLHMNLKTFCGGEIKVLSRWIFKLDIFVDWNWRWQSTSARRSASLLHTSLWSSPPGPENLLTRNLGKKTWQGTWAMISQVPQFTWFQVARPSKGGGQGT